MKTCHKIIILIVIGIAIYLYFRGSKKEYMTTDLPKEIDDLLDESAKETYYSEDSDDAEIIVSIEESTQQSTEDITSEDDGSFIMDSATSVTGVTKSAADTPPLKKNISGPLGIETNVGLNKNVENIFGEEPKQKLFKHKHDYSDPAKAAGCTINKTNNEVEEYIRKLVLDDQPYCSNNKCGDKSVIRNYRKDFLNFRNQVWDNSRSNDLSHKVARLYLEGNTGLTERVKGRKVADIYDELTRHQVIRDKNCVKAKDFDDTLHHGYFNTQGVAERHLTRDNWMYMNDVKPDGKQKIIDSGQNGYDPMNTNFSLVEIGKTYEHN